VLSVAVPLAAWLATFLWMRSRPDMVPYEPHSPALDQLSALVWIGCAQLGLAALPLLLLEPRQGSLRGFLIALGFILLAVAVWAGHRHFVLGKSLMGDVPYIGNTLTPFGVFGVPVVVGGPPPRLIGVETLALVLLAGCVAGAMLLPRVLGRLRAELFAGPVPLFTLLHLPVLLIASYTFDRYLLVLLPGVFYLAVSRALRAELCWPAGLAGVAVAGLLSLGLVHDWMAWNSARWELGRRAVASGIDAHDIEGGFEWDGWHAPGPAQRRWDLPSQGLMIPFNRRAFPHITGRYALAFRPPPDTVVRDTERYLLWLSPHGREFYLVEQSSDETRSDFAKE
jgi:hypothetical protein